MADTEVLKASCPACGKNMRFPARARGRKVKCSGCTHVWVADLPSVAPTAAEPVKVAEPDDGLFRFEDEAADGAGPQSVAEPVAPGSSGNGEAAAGEAEIDLSRVFSRSVRSTQHQGDEPAVDESTGDAELLTKRQFRLGCVYCAAAAVIGAVFWLVTVRSLGSELAFLALMVGAFAGIGMQVGFKLHSQHAGGIAAAIALLAAVGGKMVMVAYVLYPLHAAGKLYDAEEVAESDRATAVRHMTEYLEGSADGLQDELGHVLSKSAGEIAHLEFAADDSGRSAARYLKNHNLPSIADVPATSFGLFARLLLTAGGITWMVLSAVLALTIGSGVFS